MSNADENWFVEERSLALAGLLLTSRKDVRVRDERASAGGFDFLVEIRTNDPMSATLFAVVVKGTLSSEPDALKRLAASLRRPRDGSFHLPVCVVLVDVRENKAFYAWAAEPKIDAKRAVLSTHAPATLLPLDPPAVDEIVDRVLNWYRVLSDQLAPA